MFPNPRFAPSASVAFTIVGRLLQRVPESHRLSLRMTYPCQGQGYQCLSLFADYERKHICDFNILSGRFHMIETFESSDVTGVSKWPNERNYLLAFLAEDHNLDSIVDDSLAALGIPKAEAENPYVGCMALTMGAVIGRFLFDQEYLSVDNAWANDQVWTDWLESVPEDCMVRKPFRDNEVGRLWRLQFGNRSVLFDDEVVFLTGTDKAFDVCTQMAGSRGSTSSIATQIEEHLRGDGSSFSQAHHKIDNPYMRRR